MLRPCAAFAALVALPLLLAAHTSLAGGGQPLARRAAAKPAKAASLARRPLAPAVHPPAATPAPAAAASPRLVCLSGVVLGADGQPCPGVCVFPTATPRQIAVTNAEGAFQLQVPARTALHLQAELVGMGSSRVALDGESAQPVRIVLGR